MAAIRFTQRTEFASYVYNRKHTVDVLITITADRNVEEGSRAQICLSAAIDRSSSMRYKKLALVKRTMQFVVRQLGEHDQLGLVTYHTDVDEELRLTQMTADGKQRGEGVLRGIREGCATNLSGGLLRSIQQIQDSVAEDHHGNPGRDSAPSTSVESDVTGPVHSVLLLTDGMANVGITDSNVLETTLATTLRSGPSIKVHTFGYGNDHDGKLLKKLADIGGGNYYFIDKDDDVPTAFADALGGLISVVVQNVAVHISPLQPGVKIEKVFAGLKTTQENGGYRIEAADLYAEERKDIIVRLKIPAVQDPIEAEGLLNVQLSYFDVTAAECAATESVVCVQRPETVPENQETDQDFLDQRLRVNVADVLSEAAQMAEGGNFHGALNRVVAQMDYVERNFHSEYAASAMEDLREAKRLVSSRAAFSSGGNSLHHSVQSHSTQRSTDYFRTRSQCRSISRAKASTGMDPPRSNSSRQSQQNPPASPQLLSATTLPVAPPVTSRSTAMTTLHNLPVSPSLEVPIETVEEDPPNREETKRRGLFGKVRRSFKMRIARSAKF